MGGLPMSPYGGAPRLVRGWAVGAIATSVALAGHTVAGGGAPTARALLLITALAAAPCAWMSSLEWTTRRLVGVMLVAQAGLHLTFGITSPTHQLGSALPMLAWHVAATVVAVALLRYAEATLADVIDRLALRRRQRLVSGLPLVNQGRHEPVLRRVPHVRGVWLAGALLARGPPAFS